MQIKFSSEVTVIAGYAREEAMRTGSYGINPDHLALGILRHGDNDACRALVSLGVDLDALKAHIDSRIFKDKAVPFGDDHKVRLTRSGQSLLNMAAFEALKADCNEISPVHMLLALIRDTESVSASWLTGLGIDRDRIWEHLRDSSMLPESGTEEKAPDIPMKDIAGALGEQLGNLMESITNKSNIFS